MSFSSAEREKLVALFHKLGPQAPTLCDGWSTRELVAHLWLRENRPKAAAGLFVPALSAKTEEAMEQALRRDYHDLVEDWGRGPAKYSPLKFVDPWVNFAEHYIHHEDVRRANGQVTPREFSTVVTQRMYKILSWLAPRVLAKSTTPVALVAPGYPRLLVADSYGVSTDGKAVVTILGEVPELILWLFGRDAAKVRVEGSLDTVVRSSL